jgi:hypothetical protein
VPVSSNYAGEQSLYTSADGQVVISNRRVVLGSEQWGMESITGARVVSRKKLKFVYWLKLNSRTIPNILWAMLCLFGGFGVAALGAVLGASGFVWGLVIALAAVVYLAGFYFIWRTWILSLPDLYNLELTLTDPMGVQKVHRATYVLEDRMQALEVEQAVLQVVTSK